MNGTYKTYGTNRTMGRVTITGAVLRTATNVYAGIKPPMSYPSYLSYWSYPAPSSRAVVCVRVSAPAQSMRAARSKSARSASAIAVIASTTGTIRGTMQRSWRPPISISRALPSRSTVCCLTPIDGVGLTASRNSIGSPLEMPPRTPPA